MKFKRFYFKGLLQEAEKQSTHVQICSLKLALHEIMMECLRKERHLNKVFEETYVKGEHSHTVYT